jgi:hypothetical protein
MRAQYHFRPSPQGLRAWDVRRLVSLSRNLKPERVLLAVIRELDEAYWANSRQMTCREVVNHTRLMLACDLSFPVILSSDGRVMDGMHRICKALLQGLDAVEAVRFVEDPEPDYIGVHPDDLPYEDLAE